jgi:hypothetical protein
LIGEGACVEARVRVRGCAEDGGAEERVRGGAGARRSGCAEERVRGGAGARVRPNRPFAPAGGCKWRLRRLYDGQSSTAVRARKMNGKFAARGAANPPSMTIDTAKWSIDVPKSSIDAYNRAIGEEIID